MRNHIKMAYMGSKLMWARLFKALALSVYNNKSALLPALQRAVIQKMSLASRSVAKKSGL